VIYYIVVITTGSEARPQYSGGQSAVSTAVKEWVGLLVTPVRLGLRRLRCLSGCLLDGAM